MKPDPRRAFDFWLGPWEIEQTIHDPVGGQESFLATSDVRAVLGGNAIVEEWHGQVRFPWEGMTEPELLQGFSVRSYDAEAAAWRIHWMDSRRPVFDSPFVGNFENGVGTFDRSVDRPGASPLATRVVFSQIEPDSVHWRLSLCREESQSWTVLWEMMMRRRSG